MFKLSRPGSFALGLLFAAQTLSCKNKDAPVDHGAAPPPIESSKPGACAAGGGTVKDATSAAFFPRTAGDYCIDPNSEARAFGENAPNSLDAVCTELFDGECEIYKGYGLRRVVTLRYIDGKGSPGAVNVNLSRFATVEGAYGFFTKRVVADADPADSVPAALDAGGAGALGSGIAYVWRADMVAELSYTNELEPPDQLKASAERVLPSIAIAIGNALPGDKHPPSAVGILPTEQRLPMGISFASKDVLGIAGTGPGAIGFYRAGSERYRIFSLVRPDEDSAKDVLKTLRKVDGAKALKDTGVDAISFSLREEESSPLVGWVVGRKGGTVVGVGDEVFVLRGKSEADAARIPEAKKLERVKAILSQTKTVGTGSGASDKP
ncbi:MAG TPA: DUF6599 family protein [Polyangiaceae bacterium]|nr:DUF6599 family protein [Polyangiaceae bacterium]